jgi:hypothetical protein
MYSMMLGVNAHFERQTGHEVDCDNNRVGCLAANCIASAGGFIAPADAPAKGFSKNWSNRYLSSHKPPDAEVAAGWQGARTRIISAWRRPKERKKSWTHGAIDSVFSLHEANWIYVASKYM